MDPFKTVSLESQSRSSSKFRETSTKFFQKYGVLNEVALFKLHFRRCLVHPQIHDAIFGNYEVQMLTIKLSSRPQLLTKSCHNVIYLTAMCRVRSVEQMLRVDGQHCTLARYLHKLSAALRGNFWMFYVHLLIGFRS